MHVKEEPPKNALFRDESLGLPGIMSFLVIRDLEYRPIYFELEADAVHFQSDRN